MFVGARLNLALLLMHLRRFQLSLEAYRQVLADQPSSAAWNGVGLVLVELKRFPMRATPSFAPSRRSAKRGRALQPELHPLEPR